MSEPIINAFIKASIIIAAWMIAQLQAIDGNIISQGFEYAFSMGLMMLFLAYLVFELKKRDKKQDHKDAEYIALIQSYAQAVNESSITNKDIQKSAERNTKLQLEAMERLQVALNKIETMQRNHE